MEGNVITFNKPKYNPYTPYSERVLSGAEEALKRFYDRPGMSADEAEVISDGVISLIIREEKRKLVRAARQKHYTELLAEKRLQLKLDETEKMDKTPEELCWKKACIAVIGDLLDTTSKFMPFEGQRMGIGVVWYYGFDPNGNCVELVNPDRLDKVGNVKTVEGIEDEDLFDTGDDIA
jgi:hypothetical protein